MFPTVYGWGCNCHGVTVSLRTGNSVCQDMCEPWVHVSPFFLCGCVWMCVHAPLRHVHLCDAGCGCGVKGKTCVTVSAGVLPLSHPQPALLPQFCGSLSGNGPAPPLFSLPTGLCGGSWCCGPPIPPHPGPINSSRAGAGAGASGWSSKGVRARAGEESRREEPPTESPGEPTLSP